MDRKTFGKGKNAYLKRGLLVMAVVAAVLVFVWVLYQNKALFQPDEFAADQELQENQVIFPGEEDYQSDDEGTGESDFWEQEEASQEELNPENQADTSYLFADNEKRILATGNEEATVAQDADHGQASGSGNDSGDNGIVFVPDENGESDIVIPGSGNGFTGTGDDAGGTGNNDGTDSSSDNGNGNGNSNGNGNGNENGNGNGENTPDTPATPDTPSTPDAPADPDTPSTPDTPIVDPDPVPELPKDIYDNEFIKDPKPSFPDEGITVEKDQKVDLFIDAGLDSEAVEKFYYGAVVTEWKLLCATYAYVLVDGKAAYRLVSYGDNFKVEGYPLIATEDFDVTFSFRVNSSSQWIRVNYRFKVYPYKVIVQGENNEILNNLFLEENETVNLVEYYDKMLPFEYKKPMEFVQQKQLITGWSETEGGTPVSIRYKPASRGRHVLYYLPELSLGEDYEVYSQLDWDEYFPYYLQTLMGYSGDNENLTVPCGVHSIDLYGMTFKNIEIPASVVNITVEYMTVEESYKVDQNNSVYCSLDGMLFNRELTELLGIPTKTERLDIPENVEKVALSYHNRISEIHVQSEQPTQMDLTMLQNTVIYVPSEYYLNYLRAWESDLGDNRLISEEDAEPDYVVRDGAILSGDGKILYQILGSQSGNYTVPEGVEQIKTDALAESNVDMLILPDSVTLLESNSVSASNLYRIVFKGTIPAQICADTFGNGEDLEICVPEDTYEEYLLSWSEVLDAEMISHLTGADIEVYEERGFTCWILGEKVLLVQVPADLSVYSGDLLKGVTVTEILANAFEGCTSLVYAEIPQEVKRIGRDAFLNCEDLQEVLIQATDRITVGSEAFSGCWGLRFVVSLAQNASFADEYLDVGTGYCLPGSQGYPGFIDTYDRYEMRQQGDGRLLYGVMEDEAAKVLLNTDSYVSGEIVLDADTVEIAEYAFWGCGDSFTLDVGNASRLETIGTGAFYASGLSGELTLPGSVTYVGEVAFSYCYGLEKVLVECEDLFELPGYAFSDCVGLTSVEFTENCRISSIGFGAFGDDSALTTIQLPKGLESIGSNVFDGCSSLQEVYLQTEEPLELIMYSVGISFSFGTGLPEEFRIVLPEGVDVNSFIDAWKYSLLGVTSDTELTEQEILDGENLVRALLKTEETISVGQKQEVQVQEPDIEPEETKLSDDETQDVEIQEED